MGTWSFTGGRFWNGNQFESNTLLAYDAPGEESRTVELGAEDILCRGLIDTHCHLWAPGAAKTAHIAEQSLAATGIVGAVDFGSYGYDNWEGADRFWRAANSVFTRSFLNICPEGHVPPESGIHTPAKDISMDRLVETFDKAEGRILGFKVHLGAGRDARDDLDWLQCIREAGDRAGAPVGVHITETYLDAATVLSYLKKDDVLIHVYHGKRGAPIQEDGTYADAVIEAQKRGVLMDCATGKNNFAWKTFHLAAAKGFLPDLIANDMTFNSWQADAHKDLPFLISSFAAIGKMPLEKIFAALTTDAARFLGMPDRNSAENLLLLRRVNHPITVTDALDTKQHGYFQYKIGAFLRRGVLVRHEEFR